MKMMIKTLVVVALMSKGLCAVDVTSTQGYDFVSQKLLANKVNAEQVKPEARGCMGTLVRETAFVVPSAIAGYLTAAVLSAIVASNERSPNDIFIMIGGTLAGGPISSIGYYTFFKMVASFCNTKSIALPTLQEFVKNWNVYKNNVPAELHKEFDALYFNYLKNQGKLALKESQAKEILNRVLTFCAERSEAIQCTNGFGARK